MITMEQITELEGLIAEDSELSYRAQADEVRKHTPELLSAARNWVEFSKNEKLSFSSHNSRISALESENEKLRALVREAMSWTQDHAAYDGTCRERAEKALKGEG